MSIITRGFDEWRNLTNCCVTWYVADDQAERAVLLDKIACKCCELERKGQVVSIWYAIALVRGQPCRCGQCVAAKD